MVVGYVVDERLGCLSSEGGEGEITKEQHSSGTEGSFSSTGFIKIEHEAGVDDVEAFSAVGAGEQKRGGASLGVGRARRPRNDLLYPFLSWW